MSGPKQNQAADREERAMALMWYVLRVQSSREEKIQENLQKRVKSHGLETLFGRMVIPTETVQEIKGGKKRERTRKVYPGYLYLEIDTIEDDADDAEQRYRINGKAYHLIRETPGVGDFVGDRDKPVPMSEDDVKKILKISEPKPEGEAKEVKLDFKKSDAVKIKDGPFDGFEGLVDDVDAEQGKVKVIVTIFGRATPVWLEYWQVEHG